MVQCLRVLHYRNVRASLFQQLFQGFVAAAVAATFLLHSRTKLCYTCTTVDCLAKRPSELCRPAQVSASCWDPSVTISRCIHNTASVFAARISVGLAYVSFAVASPLRGALMPGDLASLLGPACSARDGKPKRKRIASRYLPASRILGIS